MFEFALIIVEKTISKKDNKSLKRSSEVQRLKFLWLKRSVSTSLIVTHLDLYEGLKDTQQESKTKIQKPTL